VIVWSRRSETTPKGSYTPSGLQASRAGGQKQRFRVSDDRRGVSLLVLCRRDVPQRGVQPAGVKPGDVDDGLKLQLGGGAPDAIGDQLGLVAVDEALGERVVIAVADRADRREHPMV
jgi:hypothetical protein